MVEWYRIEDWATAPGVDEYGDPIPGSGDVDMLLRKYPVIRETPQGAWLQIGWTLVGFEQSHVPERRWCSRYARKRFACPTVEEALESFVARKKRQASIYEARAKFAYRAIKEAQRRYSKKPIDDFTA